MASAGDVKEIMKGVAHEVKNPLGGIRGAAQLWQELGNPDLQSTPTSSSPRWIDCIRW